MNNFFLCIPGIGNTYIRHVLIQYDHPLIFVCEDDFDSLYLFNETCDCSDYEEWIALKIKREDYFNLIENRVSFRKAFDKKTNIPYYIVKHEYANKSVSLETTDNPPSDYLPLGDVYMSMFSDGEKLFYEEDTDSEILEIETFPNLSIGQISVQLHNKFCESIVGMLKGVYSDDVFVGLLQPKAASYAIRLKINSKNKSKISAIDAIKKITSIVNPTEKINFEGCVDELKVKENSQSFFEAVATTQKDVILVYNDEITRNKVFNTLSAKECKNKANEIKEIIKQDRIKLHIPKEQTFQVEGALIGYDLKSKKFVFQYKVEKQKQKNGELAKIEKKEYVGKLSDNFSEKQFVGLDCFYIAEIRKYDDGMLELVSLKEQSKLEFGD